MGSTSFTGTLDGYQSQWSAPTFDKKSGTWKQSVTGFKQVTDDDRNNQYLQDLEKQYQLNNKADALRQQYGYDQNNQKVGSSSSTTSASGTGSGGLFGSGNILGGMGYADLVNSAKDMARFRLGLDQEQARFSRGLREEESQADFGRNYKLADQQIVGQKDLEGIRQNATTDRLSKQLDSQQLMQQKGFDFSLTKQATERAAALRGLR